MSRRGGFVIAEMEDAIENFGKDGQEESGLLMWRDALGLGIGDNCL